MDPQEQLVMELKRLLEQAGGFSVELCTGAVDMPALMVVWRRNGYPVFQVNVELLAPR